MRLRVCLVLAALSACSAKAPGSGSEPARATGELLPTQAVTAAAGATPGKPAPPPPDPREAALAKTVVQLLEQEHLLHKTIDDTVSRAAFDTYLDRLDGLKMFFLKADRDALAQYADKIDDELRSGSLDLAHEGAKRFTARVEVVDKYVAEILAQPMNHSDEEFLETDPKKMTPANTEQELRDRWRQRLELEVLERVGSMEARLEAAAKEKAEKATKNKDPKKAAAGSGAGSDLPAADEDDDRSATPLAEIPATPEAREAKARGDIAKSYAGRFARLRNPATLDAAADLINAVTATLDPHTTYLPPSDKANFDIGLTGQLEGIGASLRERDHYIEVVELVPGGAAWRQGGLSPGDVILAVQQENKDAVDVVDMRLDDVVKMIRGPKNTTVRLRIQKQGGHEETLSIKRDVVVLEESYARGAVLTRKGQTVGYIHLPGFYGGPGADARKASSDVRKIIAELKKAKVSGLIFDIRSNGGGLLGDAVKLAGEFIDQGPIVQVKDNNGKREVFRDEAKGTEFDGPMIVMVDRFSASASEILAGAMQDYHRAVIVGTGPTHGKGTVQSLADLDRISGSKEELGVLKLTIEQFFRVSGSSTQREGVTPDVILPDPVGHLDTGERELDHAIEWSSVDEAPHDVWKGTWKPVTLQQKSAARVAKHPILSKIAAASQVLRARKNDTKVPLAQPAWDQRRKELRAALDAVSPDLKKATPSMTVKPIDDPAAPVIAPGPGGRQDDRPAKWRDSIATDPWLDEAVSIMADMGAH
jgi:carboxyl-terminal processing protease